jgi:RHS repeat-associated protein
MPVGSPFDAALGTEPIRLTAGGSRGRAPEQARARVLPNAATPHRLFHFSLLTDHSALPPTLIAKYAYDGLFRRITRQIGTGPVIHTYYNAQWRPLQETEQTGETTALARTYDWGLRYRDDLIRRINHLEENATHYALHDYYNVTAIVGCTSSSSSSSSSESSSDGCIAVLERYGYSAFGDVRFMTAAYVTKPASDHAWDLLYKAQFRDIETGFDNYGYRYLSSMLGRWLSRDPIGEIGGLNLYGFVTNNGLNGTDFFELEVWAFSGIRFGFLEKNRNYVRDGLLIAAQDVSSQVEVANTGSSKPDEIMRDHPSASDKALVFGLLLSANTQLEGDATEKAEKAVTEGQFCKACSKRKTKINLFMVAPKKTLQDLPKTDCCDIAYIVYFDRRDIVPQRGMFTGWKYHWSGKTVSAWEVDLAAPIHHGFSTDLELKNTPENGRFPELESTCLTRCATPHKRRTRCSFATVKVAISLLKR